MNISMSIVLRYLCLFYHVISILVIQGCYVILLNNLFLIRNYLVLHVNGDKLFYNKQLINMQQLNY